MKRVIKKPVRVVCMGDSITEGFGLGTDPKLYYPGRLQELLREGFEVYNQGVSGCCVTNTLNDSGEVIGFPYGKQSKYREALDLKGDIYLLLLGTNDAQDGRSDDGSYQDQLNNLISYEKKFKYYYQIILDSVKKSNPQAEIFICKPAPVLECIWPKHQQKYLDILLPYFNEIMEHNPDCHFIDVFAAFKNNKEPLENFYQTDGLHPNLKGAELIADTVYKALQEQYPESQV